MKLDWAWIWADFDAWYMRELKRRSCKVCGRGGTEPDWPEQKEKIEQLIQQDLRDAKSRPKRKPA